MKGRRRIRPATGSRPTPVARRAAEWIPLPLGAHTLAESPRWNPEGSQLGWVDIAGCTLHTATRDDGAWSSPHVHKLLGRPTSLEPVPGTVDSWDVASSGRLVRLTLPGGRERGSLMVSPDFPRVRTNDTFRDPAGRVLVGLFTEDRASPAGGIVSIDPQLRSCRWVVGGMVTANGLGLDRTATRLYAVDTARGVVVRHHYDVRTGDVGPYVVIARHPGPGKLDGLLVLDDDTLLVAVWGEGALRRYDPDGGLLDVLPVPAARPTALASLAGPDGGLVLTTAADPDASKTGADAGGRLYWTRPPW